MTIASSVAKGMVGAAVRSVFNFRRFALQQSGDGLHACTDAVAFGAYLTRDVFLRRAGRPPALMTPNDLDVCILRPGFESEQDARPVDWVPRTVLDIGTGTGVLSLMVAQRLFEENSPGYCAVATEAVRMRENGRGSIVHAIEPNDEAFDCARANIAASPWSSRMEVFKTPFQYFWRTRFGLRFPPQSGHFGEVRPRSSAWARMRSYDMNSCKPMPQELLRLAEEFEAQEATRERPLVSMEGIGTTRVQHYDLIVCNPPFNDLAPTAKHSLTKEMAVIRSFLPLGELLEGTLRLLSVNGQFWVLLPDILSDYFVQIARQRDLRLVHRTRLRFQETKAFQRSMLCFVKSPFPKPPFVRNPTRPMDTPLQYERELRREPSWYPKCMSTPLTGAIQLGEWLYMQTQHDSNRAALAIDALVDGRCEPEDKPTDGLIWKHPTDAVMRSPSPMPASDVAGSNPRRLEDFQPLPYVAIGNPVYELPSFAKVKLPKAPLGIPTISSSATPVYSPMPSVTQMLRSALPKEVIVDRPIVLSNTMLEYSSRGNRPPRRHNIKDRTLDRRAREDDATDPPEMTLTPRELAEMWWRPGYVRAVVEQARMKRLQTDAADPRLEIVWPPSRELVTVMGPDERLSARFLRMCAQFYRLDLMRSKLLPAAVLGLDGSNAFVPNGSDNASDGAKGVRGADGQGGMPDSSS